MNFHFHGTGGMLGIFLDERCREPAQTVVHAFDINVPANLRVGYITAEGEMIPEALKRLGINVEMLVRSAERLGLRTDLATGTRVAGEQED